MDFKNKHPDVFNSYLQKLVQEMRNLSSKPSLVVPIQAENPVPQQIHQDSVSTNQISEHSILNNQSVIDENSSEPDRKEKWEQQLPSKIESYLGKERQRKVLSTSNAKNGLDYSSIIDKLMLPC